MTFLKPLKAQQAFLLLMENVRRYKAGQTSYAQFFYRAQKLWRYVSKMPWEAAVENAYLVKMGVTK